MSFIKNCQTAFQRGCIFCISTSNEWVFLLLHLLASIWWFQHFEIYPGIYFYKWTNEFNKTVGFKVSIQQEQQKLMLSNCGAEKESWVPWTSWRSNQSTLKEINPETHWKDWYWGWNSNTLATWCKGLTPGKDPDAGKDWRQKESGTEDEMVGWHHWFNRHELGHTPGDGEGQGGLVCYNPWSFRPSDMTWWLNYNIQQ